MRRESEKVVTINIVINDEVVGELTDDGEIKTDDIQLKKLADRISRQNLTDLRSRKAKRHHYFYLTTVKKSEPGYVSAVIEILLENGYGLR